MKNILLPTDFSNNSWNAMEYAVELFRDVPCNFYILHVNPYSQSDLMHNSAAISTNTLDIALEGNLTDTHRLIQKISRNKAHHFIALPDSGNLIDIIRKTVLDKKIDLIVMGTKGASEIEGTIVGSNTGNAITKVPCNLLVIPEKAEPAIPKNIAFPTDYNIFYSYTILEAITKILRISKARLNVVNVSKSKVKLNTTQFQNMIYLQDYLLEVHEKSYTMHQLKDESAKNAIEDFVTSKNIDMVIMVAKNLNFLQQLLLDTTIKRISFQTRVPLLVLHE